MVKCVNTDDNTPAVAFLVDPVSMGARTVVTWKLVKVNRFPGQGLYVGFAPRDHPLTDVLGATSRSWGFFRNDGDCYHCAGWLKYATAGLN